jgi:1-acyl-sn-glycerol-3-phosphate acyltransferase
VKPQQVSVARACVRLVLCGFHVLVCLVKSVVLFPRLSPHAHMQEVGLFSKRMLQALQVQLLTDGSPQAWPVMLVANHVSWLDIFAINAVHPARFIAKAQLQNLPILGRLVACGGTLFLARERKRDAMRMVQQVAEQLRLGHAIAVFPEGTTSDGLGMLPFYPNMLQAAVEAQVPVQSVALRYGDGDHAVSLVAAFVGEVSLLGSVWAIARAKGLRVTVGILPARSTLGQDRHGLCAALRAEIADALGMAVQCQAECDFTHTP